MSASLWKNSLSSVIHFSLLIFFLWNHLKVILNFYLCNLKILSMILFISILLSQDLKPANLLISANGILRIADFGLSRLLYNEEDGKDGSRKKYTARVATRWYRAPESLYGSNNYDEKIDIWAVGCIIAEINNKAPLFAVS